jgi:hypothetical protein
MQIEPPFRRKRAKVSMLGTTQMHLRSPWIIALWSAIFPGMGHLLLSKYISGFILFAWEVFVNLESHLNLAIYYSFIGKAELAKEGYCFIFLYISLRYGTAIGQPLIRTTILSWLVGKTSKWIRLSSLRLASITWTKARPGLILPGHLYVLAQDS